jgi:hypothetical protein
MPGMPENSSVKRQILPGMRGKTIMKNLLLRQVFLFLIGVAGFSFPLSAWSENVTIRGRILNGTSGETAEAEEVKLIELESGMKIVSMLRDVKGSYIFENVDLNLQTPHLIQINYRGVNYTTTLVPGRSFKKSIKTTVYDTTSDAGDVSVTQAHWILVKDGDTLKVEQVFVLKNETETPKTFVHPEETFRFYVPQEAETDPEVAVSSGKMPIKQAISLIDGTDFYAIHYPIKPGETQVMVRYELPYAKETAVFRQELPYDIGRVGVFTYPTDMQIENSLLTNEGVQKEIGFALRQGSGLKKGEIFEIKVTGGEEAPEPKIITAPHRTQRYLVYFCPVFLLLLVLGMIPAFKKVTPEEIQKHRQILTQKLIQLHEKFLAGQISEKEYEKSKNHLKSQLLYILNMSDAKRPS